LTNACKFRASLPQASLTKLSDGEDEAGIKRSRDYFHKLIQAEVDKGIPPERIMLGGFSQGGAMSIYAGLSCPHKLGGIFALSAYLVLRDSANQDFVAAGDKNKTTKIFMGHGDADTVVQYKYGVLTSQVLQSWGYDVDFKTYP